MINILIITQNLEQFILYLNHNTNYEPNKLQDSDFITKVEEQDVTYCSSLNKEKTLSRKYMKIVFVSMPRWMAQTKVGDRDVISYLYDNNLIKIERKYGLNFYKE